jgi:hypothetical protein
MNFVGKDMYSKYLIKNAGNTISKNQLRNRDSTKGDFTLDATGSIFSEFTPKKTDRSSPERVVNIVCPS